MALQDEFRRRHPGWKHRDVPFLAEQAERLSASWQMMLDSQNGRDVDECAAGIMSEFLRDFPNLSPPGKMLIIGAGTGVEVGEATALGWDVTGTTLGPMNVAVAHERGIDLHFCDIHTSPYETGRFDAVVGRQVWEHTWSPFLFAIECARVLRPGGRIILETPCCADFIYASDVIHHVFCPTPFQGARLLEKAGFVDVTVFNGADHRRLFSDDAQHRDDVGGGSLQFTGVRWNDAQADKVNPLVRLMTSVAWSQRAMSIFGLYNETLGRAPDVQGLKNYVESRLSLDEIRHALRTSAEGKRRAR